VAVTVVTAVVVSPPRPMVGDIFDATATCPAGQQATGGGVRTATSDPRDTTRSHMLESGPVPGVPPSAWFGRVAITNGFVTGDVLVVTVSVLCVPAP